MLKIVVFVAVILSMVFPAGRASATIVSVAESSVANGLSVTIYVPNYGDNVSTTAGNYIIKYETDPSNPVSGFCIDPHISSTSYQPYVVQSIPEGSGFEAAAWVLNHGYSTALAAAAQVAVWELTWDYQYNRGFDLTTGDFRLNSPTSTTNPTFITNVTDIYNAALAGMGGSFNQSLYVVLHSPADSGGTDYQDFIVPKPAHTPVPASVLLLGSGLLGLGLWSLKRKAGPDRKNGR